MTDGQLLILNKLAIQRLEINVLLDAYFSVKNSEPIDEKLQETIDRIALDHGYLIKEA